MTHDERPVAIGTRVAVSVATTEATAVPPFDRYDLQSRTFGPEPPALPARLPLAATAAWNALWSSPSNMATIVKSVEFFDSFFYGVTMALTIAAILLILALIVLEVEQENRLLRFVVAALVLCILFVGVGIWNGAVRKAHLAALRTLCSRQHADVFRNHGVRLECYYEWAVATTNDDTTHSASYGFRLYILKDTRDAAHAYNDYDTMEDDSNANDTANSNNNPPLGNFNQDGYFRIRLFHSKGCCSWSPISMSYLSRFQSLPFLPNASSTNINNNNESSAAEAAADAVSALWSEFWIALMAASRHCLTAHRGQFVAQWSYSVVLCLMIGVIATQQTAAFNNNNDALQRMRPWHTALWYLFLICMVVFLCCSCRFSSAMHARSVLIHLYSLRMGRLPPTQSHDNSSINNNLYMEYRTVVRFDGWCHGMHGVHYLYVFPPPHLTLLSTIPVLPLHVNADNMGNVPMAEAHSYDEDNNNNSLPLNDSHPDHNTIV